MKNFPTIICLGVCVLLTGCSKDQYSIERQYYQAKKQAETILANPHSTPPRELQRSVDTFNQFTLEYPKSNLAVGSHFNIAELYLATEEFGKARLEIDKTLKIYAKFPSICAQALFLKGNSYELQNQWESALAIYKEVINRYPLTTKSLETPIYIAQHYKVKFQPDQMMEAYKDAIDHYNTMAEKYPMTPLALQLNILSAQCYAERKDWNQVVNVFNYILKTYSGKAKMDGVLFNLAMVLDRDFHDKAQAKVLLEKMIKEYPSSRMMPLAKSLLTKINTK